MVDLGRLIISLEGTSLSTTETAWLAHPMVAGVLLFERNYEAFQVQRLAQLVAQIQTAAIQAGRERGLPVLVDQEGGHIQRLRRGFRPIPPACFLGEIFNQSAEDGLKLAHRAGRWMAEGLAPLGITSLAPVVDLDQGNSVISGMGRSFHPNPDSCYHLASAFIAGMKAVGMPATLKHFPGHGRDIGDSHLCALSDPSTLDELLSLDLQIYQRLIESQQADAIMPAHITFPNIDPQHTVLNSAKWMQEILRESLGFDGVVISDCLSMSGAQYTSFDAKVDRALEFADLVICANLPPGILDAVLQRYPNGAPLEPTRLARVNRYAETSLATRLALLEPDLV